MEETFNNRKMRRFCKLKKWPLCKGSSLCKMVSFRQKIKLPKTCGKRLYKYITVVLCKKRMEETANNEEMRRFWKLEKWPLCKGKMVSAFAKWSVFVKKKNCQKDAESASTSTLQLFSAEKGWKKQAIFEKWDDFENWKNGHCGKAIAFAKWSVFVKK